MRFFALERMWEIASLHSSLCATIITQAGSFSNQKIEPIVIISTDVPDWSLQTIANSIMFRYLFPLYLV